MKVPRSFAIFQQFLEATTPLTQSNALQEIGQGHSQSNTQELLSGFCDLILSTLHTEEDYRDAVIDSRCNLKDKAILLLLNEELDDLNKLVEFLKSIPQVGKLAYAKRERNGDVFRVFKVQPKGTDADALGQRI